MPLFGPVAVPILIGLIKEFLGWRRRRRVRRSAEAAGPAAEVEAVTESIVTDSEPAEAQVQVAEAPEAVTSISPPTRALRSRKKIID